MPQREAGQSYRAQLRADDRDQWIAVRVRLLPAADGVYLNITHDTTSHTHARQRQKHRMEPKQAYASKKKAHLSPQVLERQHSGCSPLLKSPSSSAFSTAAAGGAARGVLVSVTHMTPLAAKLPLSTKLRGELQLHLREESFMTYTSHGSAGKSHSTTDTAAPASSVPLSASSRRMSFFSQNGRSAHTNNNHHNSSSNTAPSGDQPQLHSTQRPSQLLLQPHVSCCVNTPPLMSSMAPAQLAWSDRPTERLGLNSLEELYDINISATLVSHDDDGDGGDSQSGATGSTSSSATTSPTTATAVGSAPLRMNYKKVTNKFLSWFTLRTRGKHNHHRRHARGAPLELSSSGQFRLRCSSEADFIALLSVFACRSAPDLAPRTSGDNAIRQISTASGGSSGSGSSSSSSTSAPPSLTYTATGTRTSAGGCWEDYVRYATDSRHEMPFAYPPVYLWHAFLSLAPLAVFRVERGCLTVEHTAAHPLALAAAGTADAAPAEPAGNSSKLGPDDNVSVRLYLSPPPPAGPGLTGSCTDEPCATTAPLEPPRIDPASRAHYGDLFLCLTENQFLFYDSFGSRQLYFSVDDLESIACSAADESLALYPFCVFTTKAGESEVDQPSLSATFTFLPVVPPARPFGASEEALDELHERVCAERQGLLRRQRDFLAALQALSSRHVQVCSLEAFLSMPRPTASSPVMPHGLMRVVDRSSLSIIELDGPSSTARGAAYGMDWHRGPAQRLLLPISLSTEEGEHHRVTDMELSLRQALRPLPLVARKADVTAGPTYSQDHWDSAGYGCHGRLCERGAAKVPGENEFVVQVPQRKRSTLIRRSHAF